MDYDTYKLMTPEEASNISYADIEVEIGVWVTLNEYKKITVTFQVPIENDWDEDKGDVVVPSHITEDVMEYMFLEFPNCEYDLINWRFI